MPIDECSRNSPSADQGEKLDCINRSNKTVKSPSVVLRKRKRTDEGDDASKMIPWELHLEIQEALKQREFMAMNKLAKEYSESESVYKDENDDELKLNDAELDLLSLSKFSRKLKKEHKNESESVLEDCEDRVRFLVERFKKLKQLPRDWKYDPATASTFVAIEPDNSALQKLPPHTHKSGAAASNKIPWELHLQIQEALELRELVERNKNDRKLKKDSKDKNDSESESDSEDENGHEIELELCEDRLRHLAKMFKKMKQLPRDWKYDPDTASTFVAIEPDNSALQKLPPPPQKRLRCCLAVSDPNQKFPKTRNVPLNEEEKKIWMDFEEFDKDNHGLKGVPMTTRDQYRRPLHCDNPIVSLTGNFAVTAFNEAIEMYVKKDEKNNIHDFEIVECKYLKTYKTNYYFYITIEAFEERKFGVYDAKVRLNRADGSLSLLHFVLTDREPRVVREPTKLKTHPDSWQDGSRINHSGMRLRRNRSICRGYDYRTPWGDSGP